MLELKTPPLRPLIAASILSADFGRMADECRDVLTRGADLLHVDVMDGHFVPNLTMGADMVRGLRKHFADTLLDVHLMVERPDLFVDGFADAGANHLTFHIEVCRPYREDGVDAESLARKVRSRGMTVGVVLNPPTPVEALAPFLPLADIVLIMSVNPGRSGQKFIPEVLPKARWVKERIGEATRLEIDGGINPQTAVDARAAGVDMFVTASALFGASDRSEVIRKLHAA